MVGSFVFGGDIGEVREGVVRREMREGVSF